MGGKGVKGLCEMMSELLMRGEGKFGEFGKSIMREIIKMMREMVMFK